MDIEEIAIIGAAGFSMICTLAFVPYTMITQNNDSPSAQAVEQKANEANELMISKMNESLEQELTLHPGFLAQEKSWVLSRDNKTVYFGGNKDFERVGEKIYSAHIKNQTQVLNDFVDNDAPDSELIQRILDFDPVINIDHGSYSVSAPE